MAYNLVIFTKYGDYYIYIYGELKHTDLQLIEGMLRNGETVNIRPATSEEHEILKNEY